MLHSFQNGSGFQLTYLLYGTENPGRKSKAAYIPHTPFSKRLLTIFIKGVVQDQENMAAVFHKQHRTCPQYVCRIAAPFISMELYQTQPMDSCGAISRRKQPCFSNPGKPLKGETKLNIVYINMVTDKAKHFYNLLYF